MADPFEAQADLKFGHYTSGSGNGRGLRSRRVMTEREKIRVAVVDDEPLARSNLRVLLGRDPEVELVSECGSGAEALREIRKKRPELVFLDVQMPECDGFDVLEQLGTDLPPALVFVTAYDQYALQAFEAGALDYLLKPYNNARFERALRRAKERVALRKPGQKIERIAIKNAGEVLFLKIAEIDWIEAADYYVCLHVGAKSHLLRRSMADVEAELDAGFCRVHRSAIVNLEWVRRLENGEDGGTDVVLTTGARLSVSRRYRRELQERMAVRK
jgi:two-component system, LytTR family, response regulator